jgi:hypothetical protein
MSRHLVVRWGAAAAAVLAVAGLASPASAARRPGGAQGSCSVSGPVTQYGSYTVVGSGLPASTVVNVYVSDSGGTQWSSTTTSSSGTMSVSGYASYTGTYSVSVTSSGRKPSTLATCSFAVS